MSTYNYEYEVDINGYFGDNNESESDNNEPPTKKRRIV